MNTVLVTAPTLGRAGIAKLREAGFNILFIKNGVDELEQIMATQTVDAVISRTLRLSGSAIRACKSLKIISKHGAGVNNIDIDAATDRGVPVVYTPGANAQSVAELTFGLALSVARKIPYHDRSFHNGGWTRTNEGIQLSGRTLGLVGIGDIGSKVGELGLAFGMDVVAYDPNVANPKFRMVNDVADLFPIADVLSLHVPLNASTKNMIDRHVLSRMKSEAILINTARGGIVDEDALATALEGKAIWGAGFDVGIDEPPKADSPLRSLGNFVMTPHMGGSTSAALEAVASEAAGSVVNYLIDGLIDVQLCVNPAVLEENAH